MENNSNNLIPPLFPKASTMFLHTGDIIHRLKSHSMHIHTNSPSSTEILQCLGTTFSNKMNETDRDKLHYANFLNCGDEDPTKAAAAALGSYSERAAIHVTVKLFLYKLTGGNLCRKAISSILSSLGITYIDSLVVQLPDSSTEAYVTSLLQLWPTLEEFVDEGKVVGIGVTDLQKSDLLMLCSKARIMPSINQINLPDCCAMPPELASFAKENDIQLLTHNDPTPIVTNQQMRDLIREKTSEHDAAEWEISWLARYHSLIKCRGIITSKGYFTEATRNTASTGNSRCTSSKQTDLE